MNLLNMVSPKSPRLVALSQQLALQCLDALPLPFASVRLAGWVPRRGRSFTNAMEWASNVNGWSPVPGWQCFDCFDARSEAKAFMIHTAVRDPGGTIWDITPSPAGVLERPPFLVSTQAVADFCEDARTLVELNGEGILFHLP